jgi:hypothetical protein
MMDDDARTERLRVDEFQKGRVDPVPEEPFAATEDQNVLTGLLLQPEHLRSILDPDGRS